MWTKRILINMAFDDLALAGYVFDLTPEEINSALLRMDSMMAMWETYGVRIGYQATVDPSDADPDQPSGVPDWANEAIHSNLAIRLASSFGKSVPLTLAAPAKIAYDGILARMASDVPLMQFKGNLPQGAGWKQTNYMGGPFVLPPQDLLTTGPDGLLDMNGPVPV